MTVATFQTILRVLNYRLMHLYIKALKSIEMQYLIFSRAE
jgi:hypothetical protein